MAVAVVLDVAQRTREGEKHDLRVEPLAVGLQIRGHLDPVVVGNHQFDRGPAQGGRAQPLVVEGGEIVFEQDRFRTVGHQRPGSRPPALNARQKADFPPAHLGAAGVFQHDVVAEQRCATHLVGRRIIPEPHPQFAQRLVLAGGQRPVQGIAVRNFHLTLRVVGVDIRNAEERRVAGLELGVAPQQVRGIGAGTVVRLARPRQQQAPHEVLVGPVEAQPIEGGLVESQGREGGQDLVAHHQPRAGSPALVRGDHQPIEEEIVVPCAFADQATLALGLLLLPSIDQPAASYAVAEGVVPWLAL